MTKWIKARTPKVWGYARVSTEDQSLELQLAALKRYGVDEVVTEKASGKTINRKRFKLFVEEPLYLRGGDTLVVWKLDRLGRNLSEVLPVIEELHRREVKLVSITDGFDMTTPMGKAMMQIALVFAELERNFISERTKAGLAVRKAEGKLMGRPPTIEKNKKRIRAMQKLYNKGHLVDDQGNPASTDSELLVVLNKADKDVPDIGSTQTVARWRKDGYPGIKMKDYGDVDG